ncbi:MAG TPA: M15 family metallopeptidase [Phycisphaerae bacterium]|nr:M15 family metallopeptidase [Phycisphaerae bacterium]
MANSCRPGSHGMDPFELTPDANGPTGAFDPFAPLQLLTDTPGPLGCTDHADPNVGRYSLGVRPLHLTLVAGRDASYWDYDPNKLLDDERLAPGFVEAAHAALRRATYEGLRPQVAEAYRSPERSAKLAKAGEHQAAPQWGSCHNYGLAMDVYPHDAQAHRVDNTYKGTFKGWTKGWWYKQAKAIAVAASDFVWGANFGKGDSDHLEYHPNWSGGAGAAFLREVKVWAEKAAGAADGKGDGKTPGPPEEPAEEKWMPYLWWAAGAGGTAPSAEYLAKHPAPKQAN